jgi:hypothetical protein
MNDCADAPELITSWTGQAPSRAPKTSAVGQGRADAEGRRVRRIGPDFYKTWLAGEIPCDPPGTSRIFMSKDFG